MCMALQKRSRAMTHLKILIIRPFKEHFKHIVECRSKSQASPRSVAMPQTDRVGSTSAQVRDDLSAHSSSNEQGHPIAANRERRVHMID